MNLNQISNHQSNYQPTLIVPQHNQSLQDNSVFSAVNYNQNQQASQSNVLYNLNFNQLDQEIKQCSNILYDTDTTFHSNTTNKVKLEQDELNENVENGLDTSKNKLNKSGSLGPKRQKKMKFSNEDSTEIVQANSAYLYPNSNYYHKQNLVGSSSITSSNSSSTSSSPLSSSSPSHHHSQNQINQTCLSSNMTLSNQLSMPSTQGSSLLMNNNHKIMTSLGNTHYSYTDLNQSNIFPYNHSDVRVGPVLDDLQNMKSYNDDLMENCIKNENNTYDLLDTSMEDFQRVKLKKSKKDPIVEYDNELAEAIEFELGLKKQNGPRKNSWGNLSYAELITRAIETSSDQRLTLSQIYDWIVKYVPYFKEKFDRTSSAGWKNSIRHNLSLHNRFIRVQNESSGKSSWWMINPDMSKYSLNTPIVSTNLMNTNNLGLNNSSNSQHLDYNNAHKILPITSDNQAEQNNLENNLSIKTENLDSYEDLNQLSTITSSENSESVDGIKKNSSDIGDNSTTGPVISSEFLSSQGQDITSPNYDPLIKGPFHDSTKTNRNKNISKSKSSRLNKSLNQQSKSKSKISKASHIITDADVKSEKNSNGEVINKNSSSSTGVSTYSPSSPASTSSLKENDLLTSNTMTSSSISSMENNKLSQNLIFYNQNIGVHHSSGNLQQNLLMDSPSSLSSSSSSSIPYQNCSLTSDSGNSILRAALQKSTITNAETSNSSSSSPSTPTPLQSAVPNTHLNQTVNNTAQNSLQMPFTDYNSQFYEGSSYQNSGQNFMFNQTNDNNLFSGSYQNYQNTYNPTSMNKQSNQPFYNQNYTMQSAYNTSNERYFNQTSKTSSQGPSSIASSSSALPANSSPNSSNVPTSTSYRSNSQIYSNYYIQMSQQSNTQNLMPSSNQTYQNSVFKGNHSQYSSNIYDQNLASLNQPIQYYDLNRNMSLQTSESTLDTTANANEKAQTMLASMDCSNQANSQSGYDELNGFQDLLNNNDSSLNSNTILNCNKSVGCYYN